MLVPFNCWFNVIDLKLTGFVGVQDLVVQWHIGMHLDWFTFSWGVLRSLIDGKDID